MTSKKFTNVFDATEDHAESAQNLKVRASLMAELASYLSKSGMTQAEAARRLGVSQPRVSDLVRGKIDLFSIDALVNMLSALDLRIDVRVRKAG